MTRKVPDPLSLGDLARALGTLEPADETTRRAIVERLGFSLAELATEAQTQTTSAQLSVSIANAPPEPAVESQVRERRYKLDRLPSRGQPLQTVPLPIADELPIGPGEDTLARPAIEPLLRPTWSRAVVSTLAKRKSTRGRPNIPKLVALAAAQRMPRRLPIDPSEIASGADVLVDVGRSMQLFARDQQLLVEQVRAVLGKEQVPVYCFAGSPMRGVTDEDGREHASYRPPAAGWPIILLTDVGIGATALDRPTAAEWAVLGALARARGSRLIALVPYPRSRWPSSVAGNATLLPWDRDTTVRLVRSLLRRTAR